jgi:hypothetical protein
MPGTALALARFCLITVCLALGQAPVSEFPQAEISNSQIRAKVYLPDAQSGYYRGTRFDWSGAIFSLEWKPFDSAQGGGHTYFGQWFERHDPKIHDAITGPVDEFLTNDSGLGYQEAQAGQTFVRIGVGAVRKPEEAAYRRFATYDIVDSGKWTVNKGSDRIEFVHELGDTNGYAYVYRKTLRLIKDTLVLEHVLRNVGKKTITTSVYNHDFFMLDSQPTGPDFVVRFPFEPRALAPLKGLGETRGKEIVVLQELQPRQTLFSELQGFGTSAKDHDFRVENRKTGAGVRQTGDRPISKLIFWSARTTVCPEAYIDLSIEPGKASSWRITYEFYQVPPSAKPD